MKTIEKELPVILTADERDQRGREMANVHHELTENAEAKKKATKVYADKEKALKKRLSDLASAVRTGTEMRPVQCDEELEPRQNTRRLRRRDTGAVVEERALTAEERQLTMPGSDREETELEDEPEEADLH